MLRNWTKCERAVHMCVFPLCMHVCAQIFKKFVLEVLYYLMSLSFKFHGDPCTNARAGVMNAHTRDKMCARALTTLAFMHGSS